MTTLATLAKKQIAAEKRVNSVVIIARYTFKDEARKAYSVYRVRSSDGQREYTCTLVNGKATGCDCSSYRPCKHETACELAEKRIIAQKAKRQEDLATAEQVAPLVLGEMSQDLPAHVDDELAAQQEEAIIVEGLEWEEEDESVEQIAFVGNVGYVYEGEVDPEAEELAQARAHVWAISVRERCSMTQERKVERTPFGTLMLMR